MIRRLIPLVALILSSSAMAQVGIGTKKAASSAQLDVVALKKGVLLPRVKLNNSTDFNPIEGEKIESLLVYHTGNAELAAGFYYWKSNAWTPLLSGDTYIDRKNYSFTIAGNPTKNGEESLVVTDNQNHSVYLSVAEIANNTTFVTNLVENQEFITKLGDNVEFINHITNNNEFIENIINELKGKYGNVNYNPTTNTFVYYDAQGVEHDIDWSALNTVNVSFTLVNDRLVITDSAGNTVSLAVEEIANNETFITNLVENQEFITKLGDNVEFINHITNNNEFIENIINELKGKYGNVNYNPTTNTFVYYDAQGVEHDIDWSALNTVNVSFTLVNDRLVITDSAGNTVSLAVEEIANNETFITNLVENQEFITKLGDNVEFIKHITENNEFIENIINELKGTYGNVSFDTVNNTFFYFDEQGNKHDIDWSALNTTNVSFTLVNDRLVITDSAGNTVSLAVEEIANNETFITNLVENQEFITKLGDNVEFINHITNNNEFIENIINELKGKYGNVNYNPTTNTFVYYDAQGVEHDIDWSALNTVNVSFTLVNDRLVITDSAGNTVSLAVEEIANNETFITNLVENQEFITKLGDNVEFIKHITENNEFIENIINELKGTYGNVSFDTVNNTFFYFDEQGNKHDIDWSALNTTNVSFTLVNDQLVVTDSANNSVRLDVAEIANNETFVTNLVENQEFITKLGDNVEFIKHITENNEFIENIINELKGTYGNVSFDTVNNTFFYFDEQGNKHDIDWSALNTVNVSFTLVNDRLVITDSAGNTVSLAVEEIANNETFVTNLVENQEFITKLGDNVEFIKHITENNEFIENIINELKGTYGNVSFDTVNNTFFYFDEQGNKHDIDWSALNTVNVSFTLVNDRLVITDSAGNTVSLAVEEIANNETFVTNLVENQEFITKLGDNVEFIKHITENNEFIENIINELKGTYGNVSFDTVNNTFFYFDEQGNKHDIDWSALNTTNVSFTLVNDQLVVTDSANNSVRLDVAEIANNETFVTNLVENQEFITKLGDNVEFIKHITENNEFIENIINELKGTYGNVSFDTVNNTFFYFDEQGNKHDIDWSALNTTNVSFTLVNDRLVITDSAGNTVSLAVEEIANNETFVTNLVENQEFITKLGDNVEFIKHITENNEFIENIINELKGTYGNVSFDTVNNTFFYFDEQGNKHDIDWSALNTVNVSFTLVNDRLVITDSAGNTVSLAVEEIANNETFITNLVENQEFITKLGDNVEFIKHITENNEFIENIINELKGKYGNVNYNPTTNTFVYYDAQGVEHDIDWSALNTTNVSFTLVNDQLVVTDSANNSVRLDVAEIANNETFVTNLVENQEFITKLGDNVEFIKHITENNEFITNIIEELKGTYGNVGYDTVNNTFFYYDENKQPVVISWDALGNTKIKSFVATDEFLTITDTENNVFAVKMDDLGKIIANNDVFVTELVDNQEFITKLGNKVEFIEQITNNNEFITNIIEELKGTYGNVGYDTVNNTFFYYDENKQPVVISWDALGNTKIKSFVATDEFLTITDTENNTFAVKMDDLGKIIANNDVFVTELVDNQEFITKLGNKVEFIEQITNNNEFITNIIEELKGTYGNVGYDTVNNTFFYYDENKQPVVISWDALGNTKIKSFVATDEYLTITDTENNTFAVKMDDLGKIIANNDVFVTELVDNQEFITKLGNKVEFIEQITNNNEFITNIIEELKGTYGNVGYDTVNNTFFYYDENKQPVVISWDALGNTKIKSFVATDEYLTITDTENNTFAVKMDDLGKIIANNDVFVTELVDNQEFITKLGNKVEFIEQITNNSEFITNIIEELKGTYGNVGYDTVNNTFFYYDENKQPVVISWDALGNTKIKSFVATDEFLTITDTENNVFAVKMDDLGKIIANNDVFVTELVDNQEFITKLGNKVEFIEQITNNNEFITNIIEELKGTYGNVGYDTVNNTFFYYDENKQPVVISWDALGNTKIKSFVATDEFLTITDTENNTFAVKMDDLGKIIANNDVFVTELVDNQEFITKLGNKVEFIEQITNNSEFITNIIEELKGTYGNVGYDTVNNTFFYYDENKQPVVISWDALGNTKIKSFVATDEFLTITDTENNVFAVKMDDLGKIIANNDVFVTELVDNQEFITKLGNKVEFIEQITNNNEFITNIIEELKGTYGNVGYDTVNNTFFYYDENKQPVVISWDALGNTKIKSFVATDEFLTITDTENNVFAVKMDDLGKIIANNDVFVTELVDNQEFITKLGNKVEFIEQITNNNEFITNIIEELKGTYGNVGYDTVNNTFFYYDENKQPVVISWDALGNTKIATFEIDEVKDVLIITDTDGGNFAVAISDLGKIIANNDVFVTNLVDNQEFITKLGDNQEFKTIIKGNSATSTVTLTDGTVNAEAVKAGFTFNNGKDLTTVEFAETLTAMEKGADAAGLIEYYFVDETGNHDDVIIQVTQDIITDFEKIINDNTVKTLLQQFISSATGDVSVVRDTAGDIIIKTATDAFNISDEIRAQETNTTLTSSGSGVYVYKNEEAIKTNGAGITINVVADVQNNFQEIIDHTNVQTILNDFITQNVSNIEVITKPNGDTVFVIYEGGVKKEVNITELIKDNSYVASLEITDKTVNAEGVQAGFSFNDGKNAVSEVFAETLTSLSKGVDAANKIEYSYVDETGVAANTKITVTQDIITDFDKILNDNTVKTLLQEFISSATGDVSVVRDNNGDLVIKTATDSFNLTEEIKSKETKTTLTSMKYPVYVYLDEVNGELLEVHEERERPGETYVRTYDATKYVYNNEANEDVEIKGTDLFGATGGNSLETVTSLTLEENYAGLGKALVYENEEKSKSPIYLKDIFDSSETLTTLEMKLDNRELIYTDEVKNKTILSFNDLVQEPWYTGSDVQATKNDQDIYTMGWVGIGYKTKSTAPNERLRVNGSITATNSYYADYVFENYFDGYSSLKYDYTFNDLTTVDSYIKTNRHLPGITPISELEKTATGYSFNVSELSIQLLEKTEELFLHVIEQKKELDQKADEIQELKNEVRDLTERLEAIEALLK